MTDINNPAHRLHGALTAMKQNLHPDVALISALPNLFQTDRQDELFRNLATLAALPEQALNAIAAVATNQNVPTDGPQYSLYTAWYPKVRRAFDNLNSLASATSTVIRIYDEADLHSLQAAAFWISPQYPPTADQNDIAALRDRAVELAQLVRDCNELPNALKVALLDHIARLTTALDRAWLTGTSGLRSASDEAYGAIIRTLTHTGQPETPRGRTTLQRVGQFVTAVGLITGTLGGIVALPGQVESAVHVFTGTDALPAVEQPAAIEGAVDE
ncbi:hypothetical protein [Rhodococcus sp. IEGM1428]|uniref:hypothetical protein n=1 Tax=Rhodococcus sp. IEGM1428 TaxID=3392191 RepID=UPI003D144939